MTHVSEEARRCSANRFSLISRGGECFFVVSTFGDIRVDDDDSPFRRRTMPNFKHRTVGTSSFEGALLAHCGGETPHFCFWIDSAIFATLGEIANEIRIIRPASKKALWYFQKVQQLPIPGRNFRF